MDPHQSLQYKVLREGELKGRPYVLFACHKADFEPWFSQVSDEILRHLPRAVIWYYDPAASLPDETELSLALDQMQLVVIPVTSHFVFEANEARTRIFAYAFSRHIPVLPLLKEPGLTAAFNRVCGDLECLDANVEVNDPTVRPYEEKLKAYLDSIFVSDELAERIREAFDAYIFLSYRKKDRAYANQLMRLIHDQQEFRDIAIWYDEFLTPGENYHEAIEAALRKSEIFALLVTPSLLEEHNYVMRIEYPEARKAGIPVMPAEAAGTDHEELKRLYEGIEQCVPLAKVPDYLHRTFAQLSLKEQNDQPVHNFLIGLAYLSGIDVEVDHERAVALIKSAAEEDLPEAYEKLISMYENGEGVARDPGAAEAWNERYCRCLEGRWQESPEFSGRYLRHLHKRMEFARERGDYREAIERGTVYRERLQGLQAFYQDKPDRTEIIDGVCGPYEETFVELEMADLFLRREEIMQAAQSTQRGIRMCEKLLSQEYSVRAMRLLTASYFRMQEISERLENPGDALKHMQDLIRQIFNYRFKKEADALEPELAEALVRIAKLFRGRGEYKQAALPATESVRIRKGLLAESKTPRHKMELGMSLLEQGADFSGEKRPEACEVAREGLDLLEEAGKEWPSAAIRQALCAGYLSYAQTQQTMENLPEALDAYQKAEEGLVTLFEKHKDALLAQLLVLCGEKKGDILDALGRLEDAKASYEASADFIEDNLDGVLNPRRRRAELAEEEKLGEVRYEDWKQETSLQLSRQRFVEFAKSYDGYIHQIGNFQWGLLLINLCEKVGAVLNKLGRTKEAQMYLDMAVDIGFELLSE